MEYYFFSKQIHGIIRIGKVKNRVDKSENKDKKATQVCVTLTFLSCNFFKYNFTTGYIP
jgi:hypothetical protein